MPLGPKKNSTLAVTDSVTSPEIYLYKHDELKSGHSPNSIVLMQDQSSSDTMPLGPRENSTLAVTDSVTSPVIYLYKHDKLKIVLMQDESLSDTMPHDTIQYDI